MSGHSKWSTIKHHKGAADQARAKVFARLGRQIEVAARAGGGDVEADPERFRCGCETVGVGRAAGHGIGQRHQDHDPLGVRTTPGRPRLNPPVRGVFVLELNHG